MNTPKWSCYQNIFKPTFAIFYYSVVVKDNYAIFRWKLNQLILQKMHILQPKHTKLNAKEVEEILNKLNISRSQLPKIFSDDAALPEECEVGDVIKIERKDGDKVVLYYRVVV